MRLSGVAVRVKPSDCIYGAGMGKSVDVTAELAANVWQVHVEVGQHVEEGDVVVILESMKMEIPVEAPCSGTITVLNVAPESQVQDGDVMAVIDAD
jgi:biotin carboxyl carrier protein